MPSYPCDIDSEACSLRVRRGAGGKARTIGIDACSCALLDRWMGRRARLRLTTRHPVFAAYCTGQVGQPLDARYVRARLGALGDKAGITKRVHPQGLRHSLAYDLAQYGKPVHVIRRQLGHSSLAVTSRYVNHLSPAELVVKLRDRDWAPPTTSRPGRMQQAAGRCPAIPP